MGTPPVVDASRAGAAGTAASVLAAGGMVVLPTDTVYGVAVFVRASGATERLSQAKDRPRGVALAVLVADPAQAWSLVGTVPEWAGRLAGRAWPGPLTLVLPRHQDATGLDLGGDAATVGVRCPDHDLVRDLARRVGPLAVTSANRHGRPTPVTAEAAAASLAARPDLVVDGGPCRGEPSTVVDATGPERQVLRGGPLSECDLDRLAG